MGTIEYRVKQAIARNMGISTDDLKPETKFADDLGADSLDDVELVMALEDEFDLEIDDREAEKIKTVQQAIDYVTAKVPA